MALTKITSRVIHDEFQTVSSLTAASTIAIDWNSAQVFTLTPGQNTTFTFSDYKVGMVKVIIVTGSGNSRTLTFPSTAEHLGGDYSDTSNVKNFIQIICTNDSSSPEFFYTISQPSS